MDWRVAPQAGPEAAGAEAWPGLWHGSAWLHIPAVPLIRWVTLSKPFDLSGPLNPPSSVEQDSTWEGNHGQKTWSINSENSVKVSSVAQSDLKAAAHSDGGMRLGTLCCVRVGIGTSLSAGVQQEQAQDCDTWDQGHIP